MPKPLVAITLGDPAGVGPEVIAGAWQDPGIHEWCRPLVVGRPEIVQRAVELRGNRAEVVVICAPSEAQPTPKHIPCLPVGSMEALDVPPCTIDARGGQAAYDALVAAARLAIEGQVDAI